MTANVSVVVAALPELFCVAWLEGDGGALLEDLEEGGEGVTGWFVGEEMNVLGHEDVGEDEDALLGAGLLKDALEVSFASAVARRGLRR